MNQRPGARSGIGLVIASLLSLPACDSSDDPNSNRDSFEQASSGTGVEIDSESESGSDGSEGMPGATTGDIEWSSEELGAVCTALDNSVKAQNPEAQFSVEFEPSTDEFVCRSNLSHEAITALLEGKPMPDGTDEDSSCDPNACSDVESVKDENGLVVACERRCPCWQSDVELCASCVFPAACNYR